jgi:hypothetical protein
MSKTTENPKLTKALEFLSNIGDKEYGKKNVSCYEKSCAVLIDIYKDSITNAIKPKHKQLSNRSDFMMFKDYGIFKNHMSNTYALEAQISLKRAVELQIQALKGKPNKTFTNELVNSCEKFLSNKAKA